MELTAKSLLSKLPETYLFFIAKGETIAGTGF